MTDPERAAELVRRRRCGEFVSREEQEWLLDHLIDRFRYVAHKGQLRPERALSGSEPVGPSPDYLALLCGVITPAEYVRRLVARDARLGNGR